jgi:hypothetical protein
MIPRGDSIFDGVRENIAEHLEQERSAQAALKLCGSLEQRRGLGTCPTFIPLNAEPVACRTSRPRKSTQHAANFANLVELLGPQLERQLGAEKSLAGITPCPAQPLKLCEVLQRSHPHK